jgi:anti-sigma regulatory factor (Ser/Thr protein kinase)/serine/threonine protein phosphatase PrpC
MEVVFGALHRVFPMDEGSRVGEARRHAAQLAAEAELDEVQAGRLALVVTELGNNLVRHATRGRLLMAARPDSGEVEVVAVDNGPGIADLERSMADGFSTGGTPGTGLGAVKRLSDDFDIHSDMPSGTVVLSRVRGKPAAGVGPALAEAGSIRIAAPGETVCGDGWGAVFDGARTTVLVADGLGHGPDAAEAAQAATQVLAANPQATPGALVEKVHVRLRSTRGAAVAVLVLDAQGSTVRACGAGNVVARLLSGVSDRTILMQHGTAGVQIRRPEEVSVEWPPHALLVVHTDGIETRWTEQRLLPLLGRDPVMVAAVLVRDHCRGRDDATVVVLRRRDGR